MDENGPWTIDELTTLVLRVLHSSGLLDADYAGQPSGRVSAIPQERTIRWYASIGLLDKPLTMRGRTALYGRRHLYQLVSIKRLQAQGRSLAQIQEDLLGATDATLEGIAHLPSELPTGEAEGELESAADVASPSAIGAVASAAVGRSAAMSAPAEPERWAGPGQGLLEAGRKKRAARGAALEGIEVVPAVRLGSGVTLLLGAADRPLNAEDLARLEQAAGPLLEMLRERGLDGPDPGRDTR